MEIYAVLVGDRVFLVWPTGDDSLPVQTKVATTQPKRQVMTLNDFLEFAKRHPVLKTISNWDPFWQTPNDTKQ